jgi:hypothetical protein
VCAYISGLVLSPGQRTAAAVAAAVGTLTEQSTSPFTTERCTVNLDFLLPDPDHRVQTLPPPPPPLLVKKAGRNQPPSSPLG